MQKCGGRGVLFEGLAEYKQDIEISGKLYSLGGFPGLVMGHGIVKAELFEFIDEAAALRTFDRIEGYGGRDPDHCLYTRTVVWVDEVKDFAWVYTYNNTPNPKSLIESGDWYGYTH